MSKYPMSILIATIALLAIGGAAISQEADGSDESRSERHKQMRQQHGERGSMNAERMIRGMARRLDLDETQVEQMTNIVESAKPEMELLRESSRENRQAMRELDVNDPDYGAQLQNLAAAKGTLESSSVELRGRIRAEIHAILTPEQQQQLSEIGSGERARGHRNRDRAQAQ
ncbi:MAG: Spy/CpxP family protein refolding chaperone [Woeseiaceae bacterium]